MNIQFLPLKVEDLPLMHNWFQEPEIIKTYARDEIFDEQMIKEKYLPRIQKKEPIPSFIILINQIPIGFIQYYCLADFLPEGLKKPQNAKDCVGIDIFIAEKTYRRQGLGPKIIQKFIYSFLWRYQLIFLDPRKDNQIAIHAFEKAGFESTNLSHDPNYLIMTYQPRLRIMLIGRPGSGKSTTAKILHQYFNIPLYHLDKYFFLPNWEARSEAEFLEIKSTFLNQPTWIIDGNATRSFEYRYQHATHCLYFNFPRYLCYWRIFKRLFIKDMTIDDRADGCKETIQWCLLKYTWSFEQRVSNKLKDLQNRYPQTLFLEIKNDFELKNALRDIFML